ncbi:hypothetical protein SJI00_21090 [Pseudomonas sp. RP23018S]|uniref:hypothetical protein n=1 Tax=Pseudomonas sp. RP23018S TaxID=3096037 RepID=UPI002ACA623F|nr:hypothetical protein [Pseudomonas sp. RP23018S]MDZ5605273.1 hypothetical protein [Pseudomonas sp. RP23018S]
MARQPASSSRRPVAPAVPTTSYPVWLPNDQFDLIFEAQQQSGKEWPVWIAVAIASFMKEPHEEITSLLTTFVRDRKNKTRTNLRISKATLELIETVCKDHGVGTKQACLQHALFMYALRTHKSGN